MEMFLVNIRNGTGCQYLMLYVQGSFFLSFFFKDYLFIYLFERESEHKSREGQRETQTPCLAGLDPGTPESWPEPKAVV